GDADGPQIERPTQAPVLTAGESRMLELVREIYAGNIVSERLERSTPDMLLILELRNEKLKELTVNLSSLARKHEDGVSIPVLKASLQIGRASCRERSEGCGGERSV